jgi:hypothetical protein
MRKLQRRAKKNGVKLPWSLTVHEVSMRDQQILACHLPGQEHYVRMLTSTQDIALECTDVLLDDATAPMTDGLRIDQCTEQLNWCL